MKQWLYWIGGALLISFIIIYISSSSLTENVSNKTELELFYDLQDTIRYYKNKDGSSTAQIKLLEADKKSLGKVLALKNKSLSDLLKSGSTQGTVFNTTTEYDTVTPVKVDTVKAKPSFIDITHNRWITLNIELKNDSLKKSIVFRDSLSVSFKKIPQGFLKKKKSVVEVKNYNPYVKINNLQSFDVTEKRVNLLLPGIAIGAVGALILLK